MGLGQVVYSEIGLTCSSSITAPYNRIEAGQYYHSPKAAYDHPLGEEGLVGSRFAIVPKNAGLVTRCKVMTWGGGPFNIDGRVGKEAW